MSCVGNAQFRRLSSSQYYPPSKQSLSLSLWLSLSGSLSPAIQRLILLLHVWSVRRFTFSGICAALHIRSDDDGSTVPSKARATPPTWHDTVSSRVLLFSFKSWCYSQLLKTPMLFNTCAVLCYPSRFRSEFDERFHVFRVILPHTARACRLDWFHEWLVTFSHLLILSSITFVTLSLRCTTVYE